MTGPRKSRSQRVAPSVVRLTLFMVVTALAFALLATTIAGTSFGSRSDYAAVFTDVTGLVEGDEVRIAGVRVGEVTGIEVAGDRGEDRTRALVEFDVADDVTLTEGTTALVRYRNLIGQRYVSLAQEQGAGERLEPGSTIPVERTRAAFDLTALFNGFKPLFAALDPAQVNRLAYEIIAVLQGEGGTIEHLLASTASLTSTLADRDAVVGRTVDNLNVVLGTLADRSGQLDQLLVQLQRFVSGLAEDREAIGESLTNVADLADSTAGLLDEARPAIDTDVEQLGALAGNLEANEQTIQQFLDTWPGKVEEITRTATFGSWFNFYLCDFTGQVVLPAGSALPVGGQVLGDGTVELPVSYDVSTARCAS